MVLMAEQHANMNTHACFYQPGTQSRRAFGGRVRSLTYSPIDIGISRPGYAYTIQHQSPS